MSSPDGPEPVSMAPLTRRGARGVLAGLAINLVAAVAFTWVVFPDAVGTPSGRTPVSFVALWSVTVSGFAVMLAFGGRRVFFGGYSLMALSDAAGWSLRILRWTRRIGTGVAFLGIVVRVLPMLAG